MKPFEYYAALPFKTPITREEYGAEVVAETVIALAGRRGGRAKCPRCGEMYIPGLSHFGSDYCLVTEAYHAQTEARRVRCDLRLVPYFVANGVEVVEDWILDYGTKTARLASFVAWWAIAAAGGFASKTDWCFGPTLRTLSMLSDDIAAASDKLRADTSDDVDMRVVYAVRKREMIRRCAAAITNVIMNRVAKYVCVSIDAAPRGLLRAARRDVAGMLSDRCDSIHGEMCSAAKRTMRRFVDGVLTPGA